MFKVFLEEINAKLKYVKGKVRLHEARAATPCAGVHFRLNFEFRTDFCKKKIWKITKNTIK